MVVLNWIIVIMIEIIGNGLLALMIIYERFVEDPQKRTVNNQLISHLCGWLIINNIIGAPIVMYGIRASDIGKSYSNSFEWENHIATLWWEYMATRMGGGVGLAISREGLCEA